MSEKDLKGVPPQKIGNGGSAFPFTYSTNDFDHDMNGRVMRIYSEGGMTLRDYFAAKAITGIITGNLGLEISWNPAAYAEQAYEIADALIATRAPKETSP